MRTDNKRGGRGGELMHTSPPDPLSNQKQQARLVECLIGEGDFNQEGLAPLFAGYSP
jgi:hypothetical protein